jgi:hypothetical protein
MSNEVHLQVHIGLNDMFNRYYIPEMVFGLFRASINNPQRNSTSDTALNLQLKCFLYGGILPSASISSSRWKLRIFNVYSALTVISYIPSLSAQFYYLYLESGNVTELTDLSFTVLAGLLHVFISSYLLIKRNALEHLVLKPEESFTEYTSKLSLGQKHILIMSEAKKKIRLYSWIFILANTFTCILWISLPHIFWYIHNSDKNNNVENGNSDNEVHWEHLCYRMWIPPSAFEYPVYQFVWIYQGMLITILLVNNTGYNSMYYAITIYTAAHFKVLANLLQDTDQYLTSSDVAKSSEQSSIWWNVTNDSPLEDETGFTKEKVLKNSGENERKNELNTTSQMEEYRSLESGHVSSTSQAEDYLVNCVKYHQALLQ